MKRKRPVLSWNDKRRFVNNRGYVMVYCPEHPKAIKHYYYLHRLVMEKAFGRILESYETVHHLVSKAVNDPEFLVVLSRAEHNLIPDGM